MSRRRFILFCRSNFIALLVDVIVIVRCVGTNTDTELKTMIPMLTLTQIKSDNIQVVIMILSFLSCVCTVVSLEKLQHALSQYYLCQSTTSTGHNDVVD